MDTGEVTASQEVSGRAVELADAEHGRAAGSDPRTSDDAVQGALLHVFPRGDENIIKYESLPSGKRRQVSRDPPDAPPRFMELHSVTALSS